MILNNKYIFKSILAVFLLSACDKPAAIKPVNTETGVSSQQVPASKEISKALDGSAQIPPTGIQTFDLNNLKYTISQNDIKNSSYIVKDEISNLASQTLARRFINPQFPKDQVTLLGVQHAGSSKYYQQIQTILDEADVVLHEWQKQDISMMGEIAKIHYSLKKQSPHIINIDNLIDNLQDQVSALDYSKPHFKQADDSFKNILRDIETYHTMPKSDIQSVEELLSSSLWMEDFPDDFKDLSTSLSPDVIAWSKIYMKLYIYMSTIDLEPTPWMADVIIIRRNMLALRALQELKMNSPLVNAVILYGAGHMDHMEKCLKAMGYIPQQDTWLTVFKEDELPSHMPNSLLSQ